MIWMIFIFKDIEEYYPKKKRKILIVFDVMNKIVTKFFIRGRTLNVYH